MENFMLCVLFIDLQQTSFLKPLKDVGNNSGHFKYVLISDCLVFIYLLKHIHIYTSTYTQRRTHTNTHKRIYIHIYIYIYKINKNTLPITNTASYVVQ